MAQPQQQPFESPQKQNQHYAAAPDHQGHSAVPSSAASSSATTTTATVVDIELQSTNTAALHFSTNSNLIAHNNHANTATMSRLQENTTTSSGDKSTTSTGQRLLRRAFTLPRNPFQRLSSRKFLKVNGGHTTTSDAEAHNGGTYVRTNGTIESPLLISQMGTEQGGNNNRRQQTVLQGSGGGEQRTRGSWKKILGRLAQQMTNVGMKSSHSLNGDRVPPLSGSLDAWPPDQIPGVTGLKNHGNTCFMNAVLQCLSHTDILAEYFVLDQYKADLKRRNKMTSRKFGTKGELTEQLALVLKALWTCKLEQDFGTTVGFKAVVDRYGTQFRSSTQHDAQEFLFWLLDKVHEDLNTAPKRKYKSMKNTFGRPDEVIAAETLANHVRGNSSFVQAVFQAQFRSSLACPQCHQQSNTFDPFHCISVQLPQSLAQLPVFVTVRYANQHPRQVKIGIGVPSGAPVSSLRAQLHTDTGIPADRMVLVELTAGSGFGRVLADSYPLGSLGRSVYCLETPPPPSDTNSDGVLTMLIANAKVTDGAPLSLFSTPFCVQIRRDVTHKELQKRLLKEMQTVLKPEVFAYAVQPAEMFRMRLQDPSADDDAYMETRVEHPLFMEMIDLALIVLCADAGPPHVKLLLEWTEPERFFADMSDDYVEHESVSHFENKPDDATTLTLEQCLEHYTRAETLSNEDAWRCPHCQKYLPVVKTLGLWSLPDILVIHFKRFSAHSTTATGQFGRTAAKLTTPVTFPLTGFDMTPHLAQQPQGNGCTAGSTDSTRPTRANGHKAGMANGSATDAQLDNQYDLYAVCYHQGDTLETGHYTAACKNPYDHQWYRFDDQKVTPVPVDRTIEDIVNNEAYILFYQRRCSSREPETSRANSTANVSLSGFNAGVLSDHWVSKIAPVPPSPISSSISQGSIGLESVNVLLEAPGNEERIESQSVPCLDVCSEDPSPIRLSDAAICGLEAVPDVDFKTVTTSDSTPPQPPKPDLETPSHSSSSSASPIPSPVTIRRSTFNCASPTNHNKSHSNTTPTARTQITRGSLSFSEVFRRRDPPLLFMDHEARLASSIGRHHSNYLSDAAVAAANGSGTGGGSASYLVIDNRSASWVS